MDLISNSTNKVAVVAGVVVGYRVLETVDGCTLSVLLDSVAPEVTFETAADIATLMPLVSAFIAALEAA